MDLMPSRNKDSLAKDYVTIDGDVLDAIIYRIYGQGPDALGAVLNANPHIRDMPVHLPAGTAIHLPALPTPAPAGRVRLWD